MEIILQKASELGRLIKDSEVSKIYHDLYDQIQKDEESKKLLNKFSELSNIMSEKEKKLEPIEVWEKEEFQKIAQKVSDNDLLNKFIQAQSDFMELMITIQKSINNQS